MDDLLENKTEAPVVDDPQKDQEQLSDADNQKLERYKQQLASDKAEVKRLKEMLIDEEVSKASQDAKKLLELHKKDPKLADEVAKKFNYSSFDEAKATLEWLDENDGLKDRASNADDDFDARYAKKRAAEIHELALKKAEKALNKLPEDQQEVAKEYFDKIALGRTLDEDTALEFAELATLYVNKDKLKSWKYEEAMSNLSSTWLSKWRKVPVDSEPKYELNDRGQLVLISNN